MKMKLKVVLEPSDDGGFTVYVPSLPGCISEGDTKEQALANIKEAIELYLEPVDDDLTFSPDTEKKGCLKIFLSNSLNLVYRFIYYRTKSSN
jgi:predicted RNase H-like HicB family nuclease